MKLYNCHAHTFTHSHVPDRFLPPWLMKLVRIWGIRFLARLILPSDRDIIDRYLNFVEVSLGKDQASVLARLKSYYRSQGADEFWFVILPMDMEHMHAGIVPVKIDEQHKELKKLVDSGEPVIPFIGTDPRNLNALNMVRDLPANHGFKGIKLYPPLGYYPNDRELHPIYQYAVQHDLPVMTHCSRGGVFVKEVTDEMLAEPNPIGRRVEKKKPRHFSDIYTDPANYEPIAAKYPQLKICLAHFGGGDEWAKYKRQQQIAPSSPEDRSWLSVILDLIQRHNNIYADISATLFEEDETYIDLLIELLRDARVSDRVLFGSDFYMMERVKTKEPSRYQFIRQRLGPQLFEQIASINPMRYLGVAAPAPEPPV
jgi:uncharacterized protein